MAGAEIVASAERLIGLVAQRDGGEA